jgi:hypothetical protein
MLFTTKANKPKHITVTTTLAPIVNQNPSLGSKYGNNRNIGSVGIAYQKV